MPTVAPRTLANRHFTFHDSPNIRHLGGYPTASGRITSDHVVRGASLHRLHAPELQELHDHGVRTIIDLRSEQERTRDVSPDTRAIGIERIEAPVFTSDASPAGFDSNFSGYAPVYRSFLDSGPAAFRTILAAIASTDGGVMFHCSVGKDRTGVAAALLLDLAGVDAHIIVADYAESATHIAPRVQEWLPRMQERGIPEDRARAILDSHPEAMESTLRCIHERWGSSSCSFESNGLSRDVIRTARTRLIAAI